VLGVADRLRLLLARVLARAPEHVVVTEPDAVLTSPELTVFMALLGSIARVERIGVMVSVANATDIWRLADRLLVLDAGRLLFAGRPDDIEDARAGRVRALTT
jgi:ABC-type branched-subunit amino acid transport system ATPase component